MRKSVHFYSEGCKLAGLLHIPDDHVSPSKHPGIVFSHGYTGSKEGMVAKHALPLVEAGYVCLTFDHRGFGESEGPEGRLMADERVDDVISGITFLTQQPEVDANAIGLFGLSFGAGVVLCAGADPRVKCVVSTSAMANGYRQLRGQRRYWEWKAFLKQLEEDRVTRVMTGQSRRVDALEISLPPPVAQGHYVERRDRGRPSDWSRPLESADSILKFRPEAAVGQLSPTAVLLVHGGEDAQVPLEEAQLLFDLAKEPKRLVVIPGASHTDLYESPSFEQAGKETRPFLDKYLRGV